VQSFADLCTIALVDEESHGTKRVVTITSDPDAEVSAARLRALPLDRTQFAIMGRVIETRKAELHDLHTYLDETSDLHPEYVDVIRQLNFRSIIVAPLVSRGHTLGLINVLRTRSGPYDDDDRRMAQALGERAGLHIDNARLYRHAQQAIQARDDVMNILAHDLRNPLNSIGIQAQLVMRDLEKSGGSESLREAVTSIRSSVTSMDGLIRDLFDAARSEAGQLVRRIRPCEPARIVADAVSSARALAASKKLELTAAGVQGLPLVKADQERVRQVLSNLLGNAIKFTPPGGSIVVSAEHAGSAVAFVVKDTGPGIAADDLPHVFDRFWKGKSSDRRGAGLGLWICNGIVKSHGGTISVESTVGEGSTFRFTLPLVTE
jgi:signal transduction histidine kinase